MTNTQSQHKTHVSSVSRAYYLQQARRVRRAAMLREITGGIAAALAIFLLMPVGILTLYTVCSIA